MKLGIYVENIRAEEKKLYDSSIKLGIDTEFIRGKSDYFELDGNRYNYDAILVRSPSYFAAIQVSNYFQSRGVYQINSAWQIESFGQKIKTDIYLKSHNIPTIPGGFAFSSQAAIEIAETFGWPVILKPNIGGFGNSVCMCTSPLELAQACDYILKYGPTHHRTLYVQKYLRVKHNLRVILINGSVQAVMERFNEDKITKNISAGGEGKKFELSCSQLNFLRNLAKILSTGFLGVDILIDDEGNIFLCEINAVCEFKEASAVCQVDIPGRLLEEIRKCC